VSPLFERIRRGEAGIRLFGLAPPRRDAPPERLAEIASRHRARLSALPLDGIVVYDLQDEPGRSGAARPFPFLPTLDPAAWSDAELGSLGVPCVVYRSVNGLSEDALRRWLSGRRESRNPSVVVLVGAPSAASRAAGLSLKDAYGVARAHAPEVTLGGIAIAERHARRLDEHLRLAEKVGYGCRFFITQAVYDPSSTRSLLSDYALHLGALGIPPPPIVLTFSPCGTVKTFELMRWLGVSFPRWVENELRHSQDFLERSVRLCEEIFADVARYAEDRGVPLGVNVESVSARREELDAAVELFHRLHKIAPRPTR
jgi:5,10-methylenetetrahydrofolate reductase